MGTHSRIWSPQLLQLVIPAHIVAFGHPNCFNWSPQHTQSHLVTPTASTGHPSTHSRIWSPQLLQLVTPAHTVAFGHTNCINWSPQHTQSHLVTPTASTGHPST